MSESMIKDIGAFALFGGIALLILSVVSIVSLCLSEVVTVNSVSASVSLILVGGALTVFGIKWIS